MQTEFHEHCLEMKKEHHREIAELTANMNNHWLEEIQKIHNLLCVQMAKYNDLVTNLSANGQPLPIPAYNPREFAFKPVYTEETSVYMEGITANEVEGKPSRQEIKRRKKHKTNEKVEPKNEEKMEEVNKLSSSGSGKGDEAMDEGGSGGGG